MRRKTQIILILGLVVSNLYAQVGNEWIDFNQRYVKIPVRSEGFYRVTPFNFSELGLSASSIDPKTFRLIRRGKECAISVIGEQDNSFDGADYIEFYGVGNDGNDDRDLYLDHIPTNPYYSLYTDTAAYFLTWGGAPGKRILKDDAKIETIESSTIYNFQHKDILEDFSKGKDGAGFVWNSEGDPAEGFVSAIKGNGSIYQYNFTVDASVINSGKGKYEIKFVGESKNSQRYINIVFESGGKTFNTQTPIFSDYDSLTFTTELPDGFVSADLAIKLQPVSMNGSKAYVRFIYHNLAVDIKADLSLSNASQLVSIEPKSFKKFLLPSEKAKVYKVDDHYNLMFSDSQINNNGDEPGEYYVRLDTTKYLTSGKIEIADFEQINTEEDYIIVTNKKLREGVNELKKFKESTLGGARKVGVYEYDKLLNTYSYGDRTPLSIRRFLEDFSLRGSPQALFLVGTGVTINHNQHGFGFFRQSTNRDGFTTNDLVPTIGSPGSDFLFTKGLGGTEYESYIPTGRLPANNNQEVLAYVTKLQDHASVVLGTPWVKNFLHLSGGANSSEANYFLGRVTRYKAIAEEGVVGANVDVFAKKTNLPIELYNLSEQVNNGLSIITYLGHSSPNTIEIDIGDVTNPTNGYTNKGKYPVLFLNGCNSATYEAKTRLENWVMAEDKGAIAGFGHSGYAYSSTLDNYTRTFYEVAFKDTNFYYKSIGEIQKETTLRYAQETSNNALHYTQLTQWVLLGDPDVRLLFPHQADFSIENNEVGVLPAILSERVTTSNDSIVLSFNLLNYGIVRDDSIQVCVKRTYNNGESTVVYDPVKVPTPAYKDTIELKINNNLEKSNGENTFEIYLDCANLYDELNEENNFVSFIYDMPSNGVNLLYPYEYAIVGEPTIDFWVESQDKEQDSTSYLFELSRMADFSSVSVQREVSASSLVHFDQIELDYTEDTTVYYWRSRINETIEGEEDVWQTASFTYISAKTGWGQFEYDQFKENDLEGIIANSTDTELIFDSVSTNLSFATVGSEFDGDYIYNTNIIVNKRAAMESLWHSGCNVPAILMLAFDGKTLLSYKVNTVNGYIACGPAPASVAHFRPKDNNHKRTMKEYLDSIPQGDYVILLSTGNNPIESIDTEIISRLTEFGCYNLDTISDGTPYAFIGRKGASEPIYEKILTDKSQKIDDIFDLKVLTNKGRVMASKIGPAKNLLRMSWESELLENERFDLDFFNGDSTILKTSVPKKEQSFFYKGYSSLKDTLYNLSTEITDATDRTLSEMRHWALCYEIAPEGTVVLDLTNESSNQINQWYQGDTFSLDLAFVNISPVPFNEKLDVSWSLRSFGDGRVKSGTVALDPLKSLDTAFFTLVLVEPLFYGKTELIVTFNPKTQLEQYYTNNSFYKVYDIEKDNAAPVVEAYFDGKFPNGVMESSESPTVEFYVIDNNRSAIKKDTLGMDIFMSGPCRESENCTLSKINFTNQIVSYDWTKEYFRIKMSFANLETGLYEVEFWGSDALGNKTEEPYLLKFYVNEKSALSYFLPYPSPFSSEMRFAYRKTGSETPENISVQIISATGHHVRTVNQDELGELKSGDNLTDWAWDGTDAKGNLLPNGVYFYKVLLDGQNIEHLSTPADDAFNKKWGSILIAR